MGTSLQMAAGEGSRHVEIQLIVLGRAAVGKSAFVIQFVNEQFMEKYDPTLEDTYTVFRAIGKYMVKMDILDTAGMEAAFTEMRDIYMRKGQAFIFMYAINNLTTLDDLEPDIAHLQATRGQRFACVGAWRCRGTLIWTFSLCLAPRPISLTDIVVAIVGNKSDLEAERKIATAKGEERASALRASTSAACVIFMETSAKTRHNLVELFTRIVEEHVRARPPPPKTKKTCALL
eukprot:Amastigsp_a6162_56.p3 type:complete len:233 gc:universal Amastigsp_a6162_56:2-700(+)